jgi:hypothetical protein
MNVGAVWSAELGPAGRILLQDGDGKFGATLTMSREQAAGIGQGGNGSASGKDAGGGLLIFLSERGDLRDSEGAIPRCGAGGGGEITFDLGIFLRAGHGQQAEIFGLAARQSRRSRQSAAQRIVVGFVGGGASGAAVEDCADGDAQSFLRDILVDGVVGEAREGVGDDVDMDLGLVGIRELENAFGQAMHLSI